MTVASALSLRIVARFQMEAAKTRAPNMRQQVKRQVKPVNPPKGIDRAIVRENGKQVETHDETVDPARRDVRPEDVFIAKPRHTGVLNLVETGEDLSHALEKQVPKDKGHDAVSNLSQYLIETQGGGGAKAVGVREK